MTRPRRPALLSAAERQQAVLQYAPAIRGVAWRYRHCGLATDDLLQEAFAGGCQAIWYWDGTGPYALSVQEGARRAILRALRRSNMVGRRSGQGSLDLRLHKVDDFDITAIADTDSAVAMERGIDARRLAARLPRQGRDIVLRRECAGEELNAIGAEVGLSGEQVRVRGDRAIRRLRSALGLEPSGWHARSREGENMRDLGPRQPCCSKGHAYTPENTYVYPDGHRHCRACKRDYTREWRKTPQGVVMRAEQERKRRERLRAMMHAQQPRQRPQGGSNMAPPKKTKTATRGRKKSTTAATRTTKKKAGKRTAAKRTTKKGG